MERAAKRKRPLGFPAGVIPDHAKTLRRFAVIYNT
jgi:hypothetical protein